jgi:hypothetical protein
MGDDSTHLRQNYAQAKSANHQTKARKPQRAPTAHMQGPPEPMQLPWTNACKPPRKQSSCFSFALIGQTGNTTGQTGAQHMNRTSTLTGDLNRSDRCTIEPRNGSKPPENLLGAFSRPKHAQTSSPSWQCMNEAKNATSAA